MLMVLCLGAEHPTSRSRDSLGQPPVSGASSGQSPGMAFRIGFLCLQVGMPSPLPPSFPDSPEDLLGRTTSSDGSPLSLSKKPGSPMKTSQH